MIDSGIDGSGKVRVHAVFSRVFASAKEVANEGSSAQRVLNDFLGGSLVVAALYRFCKISAAVLDSPLEFFSGGRQCR